MQALPDTEWTSADLLGRLERRDRFFVLAVRNRDEFEKFRLEGHSPPPPINVPDFEILKLDDREEACLGRSQATQPVAGALR